jgi:DNA-binding MarR family transcriptional regulator
MAQLKERADVAFFDHVGAIAQMTQLRIERALPGELSPAGFAVLNHLAHHGAPPTPVDLAQAFQLTKGAITNTLQRLERQGLVQLTPDGADGRKKRIALTAEGAQTLRRAHSAVRPQLEGIRAAFDAAEFAAALALLERVRGWLDRDR